MQLQDKLPSILQGWGGQSSISMERALKQIKGLVEMIDPDPEDHHLYDMIYASLDDIDMMLQHLDRG